MTGLPTVSALPCPFFKVPGKMIAYNYLATVINSHINKGLPEEEINLPESNQQNVLTVVFAGICQYWLNSAVEPEVESELLYFYEGQLHQSYDFFTLMLGEILTTINQDDNGLPERPRKDFAKRHRSFLCCPFSNRKNPGNAACRPLSLPPARSIEPRQQTTRLIWMVAFSGKDITISPKEQKLTPDGEWSKGRPHLPGPAV